MLSVLGTAINHSTAHATTPPHKLRAAAKPGKEILRDCDYYAQCTSGQNNVL